MSEALENFRDARAKLLARLSAIKVDVDSALTVEDVMEHPVTPIESYDKSSCSPIS